MAEQDGVQTTQIANPPPVSPAGMVTLSKAELQALISGAVDAALQKRDLEDKGETKQGDKVVITTQALKDRLDRARATARKEIAQVAGVEPEKIEDWIKQAKEVQAKYEELQKSQSEEPTEDDIKAVSETVTKALKDAGVAEDRIPALQSYFWGWLQNQENISDDPTAAFVSHIQNDAKWMLGEVKTEDKTKEEPKQEEPPKETKKATTGNNEGPPKQGAQAKEPVLDVRDETKVPREEFLKRLAALGIEPPQEF